MAQTTVTTVLLNHLIANGANATTMKVVMLMGEGITSVVPLSRQIETTERTIKRSIQWLKRKGYLSFEDGARDLHVPGEEV